ncbi:MAG: hypothetical protein J1F40_05730 [Prevotellaceae bacterium]|nr:hypothetical protein [Prevotellaceae bacterium]
MKKIYESPTMLVEEICVELPLAASTVDFPVFSDSDTKAGSGDILSKDRIDGGFDLW